MTIDLTNPDDRASMISAIADFIISSNDDKSVRQHAELVLDEYIVRTNHHIWLVNQCAKILKDVVAKRGLDVDLFMTNCEFHDYDKLHNSEIIPIYAIACHYFYFHNKKVDYKIDEEKIKNEFENVAWPKHHHANKHHVAEYYGTKNEKGTLIVPETNDFLSIIEMYADWMSMGIVNGGTARDWWTKTYGEDRKWRFTGADIALIQQCIMTEHAAENQLAYLRQFKEVEPTWVPPTKIETHESENPIEINKVNEGIENFFNYVSNEDLSLKRDDLYIGPIDPTIIDPVKMMKLAEYPVYLLALKKWTTTPDHDLAPELMAFGKIVDEIYQFKNPIICYRGIRTGFSTRPKQNLMGVIDDEIEYLRLLKPGFNKPGATFEFETPEPMSVARSPYLAKVYGNFIVKTEVPPDAPKLVITPELSYLLQQMEVEYPEYRAVNLSVTHEVIVFAGVKLQFEIVSVYGDISSELETMKEHSLEGLGNTPMNGVYYSIDDISDEALLSFLNTGLYKTITNIAKPMYKPLGQNSWQHIQQVYSQASRICKKVLNRTLTPVEYAAILFHDCSVIDSGKDAHEQHSADKAVKALKDVFNEVELDTIHRAIVEHDQPQGPATFSSIVSQLVAAGDFNPPDVDWMLNKSYVWGISHGKDHDERIENAYDLMKRAYGSKGFMYERVPEVYKKYFASKIKEVQKTFDKMTKEEAEKRIMEYRKKHHLSETDTSLPESSVETLSTKEYTEADINSVEDLKQFYKHCSYGLIDFKANKPWKETHKNTTFEDWEKEWRLLSVEQLLKFKCGICYDTAKMNDYFLTKWKIEHINLFGYTKRSSGDGYDDDPTHTFTVYKDTDGKWKWLEGSWGTFKNNDWSESSSDTLIKNIGKALANDFGVSYLISVIKSWPNDGVNMNGFFAVVGRYALNHWKYEIKPDESYSKEAYSETATELSGKYNALFDKYMYHGSSLKLSVLKPQIRNNKTTSTTEPKIFFTPFKGFAAIFCIDQNKQLPSVFGKHYDPNTTIIIPKDLPKKDSYGNYELSQFKQVQTNIVYKHNVKEFSTTFSKQFVGYIYSVDKDKLISSGLKEHVFSGIPEYWYYSDVIPDKVEQVRINVTFEYDSTLSNKSSSEALSDKESDVSISKYNGSKEELEIIRQCVNLSARSINPKDEGYDKPTFERLVNNKDKGPYWLIRNGNDIIGSVSIRSSTVGADKVYKCSAINDFAILEKYQGKGLGKKSLLAIIAYIRKTMKYKDIGLGVGENNTKAISLYKSVGFKIICGASWGEGDQKFIGYQMLLKYEEPSTEALSPDVKKKKQLIIDYICSICDIIDPSKLNSKRYHRLLDNMNDKEFDQWMNYVKEGKWKIHIVAPNLVVTLKNENSLKAADKVKCKLFHRLWMTDDSTGRQYLTDNEYLVLNLPVRRQQQFLDEKMSVPDNDRQIDGMTGQVTGDSKSSAVTNPEIQILAARGLDATLEELVNVRGGNIAAYSDFKRQAEETGEIKLNSLDPNTRSRVAVVGQVLLRSMMIENNIVE